MYDKKVLVVGASVIDITGIVNKKLILADSNPGKIKFSMGGVGRNIAENIVRLDIPVEFISAFGNDIYGKDLWTKCKDAGISMGNCVIGNEQSSAIYISINNPEGDLAMAVSDTGITDLITPEFLESKAHIFEQSDIIVLDTNLTPNTLEYICNKYSEKKLFVDFVSTTKAMKVKNFIGKFHTIKPNLIEP
jgi:pseudouridine kinase